MYVCVCVCVCVFFVSISKQMCLCVNGYVNVSCNWLYFCSSQLNHHSQHFTVYANENLSKQPSALSQYNLFPNSPNHRLDYHNSSWKIHALPIVVRRPPSILSFRNCSRESSKSCSPCPPYLSGRHHISEVSFSPGTLFNNPLHADRFTLDLQDRSPA